MMCYSKIQIQQTSTVPTPANRGFLQSQICHSCWPSHVPCWLAPWQIQPLCYSPYPRTWPVLSFLSLHPLLPSSFRVLCLVFHLSVESFLQRFCFLMGPFGLLHLYPHPHGIPINDLLFISRFLLLFSYSFSTYLFTRAPSLSFSYNNISKMMHSTWPTTSLFSLNSTVLPNKSNHKTFAAFFTPIFFVCSRANTHLFDWPYFFTPLSNQISAFFFPWGYQFLYVQSFHLDSG